MSKKSDFFSCGIDEAGRGPVIGPMVVAGVLCSSSQIEELKKLGVKDSKLHSDKERRELFGKVIDIVQDYKIIIASNIEIDEALNSPDMNLNLLEQKHYVAIINSFDIDEAYMDCPSINVEKFSSEIKAKVKESVKVVCEHKADLNYPIVSAASILAKVTRDNEIDKLKKEVGVDFGSGYPSDPKTQKFLAENFDKFHIFRKTWQSYKKIIDSKSQKALGDF